MDKDYYKSQYNNYNIEYLLKLKSYGSDLEESAHLAIEELLREQNAVIKNIPKASDAPKNVEIKYEKKSSNFYWKKILIWWICSAIVGTIIKIIFSTNKF